MHLYFIVISNLTYRNDDQAVHVPYGIVRTLLHISRINHKPNLFIFIFIFLFFFHFHSIFPFIISFYAFFYYYTIIYFIILFYTLRVILFLFNNVLYSFILLFLFIFYFSFLSHDIINV